MIDLKPIMPQHHHHHRRRHYYDDSQQLNDDKDILEESDESTSENISTRRMSRYRNSMEDIEKCYCNCQKCFTLDNKPCCAEFCIYCPINPRPGFAMGIPEQKILFVPFPYPLIVPDNTQNNSTVSITERVTVGKPADASKPTTVADVESGADSTATARKIKIKTTTIAPISYPSDKLKAKSDEIDIMSKHRSMKQLNSVKRSRPAWVPKYGIVPIPDHLAAKLITQLTEVRALKAKII